jgi:hypothetical protein
LFPEQAANEIIARMSAKPSKSPFVILPFIYIASSVVGRDSFMKPERPAAASRRVIIP